MFIGHQTLMFDGINNYGRQGPDPFPDSPGKNSPNSPIAGASLLEADNYCYRPQVCVPGMALMLEVKVLCGP